MQQKSSSSGLPDGGSSGVGDGSSSAGGGEWIQQSMRIQPMDDTMEKKHKWQQESSSAAGARVQDPVKRYFWMDPKGKIYDTAEAAGAAIARERMRRAREERKARMQAEHEVEMENAAISRSTSAIAVLSSPTLKGVAAEAAAIEEASLALNGAAAGGEEEGLTGCCSTARRGQDLYISTYQALDWLFHHRLARRGTLISYDDWFNVPLGNGESLAHEEIAAKYKVKFQYLPHHECVHFRRLVWFRVLSVGGERAESGITASLKALTG